MKKFKNKYRIQSTRLQNWDYRWAGAYFITICTKDRINYFGKIKDGKMILSPLGGVADATWHGITERRINIELGEFVVMPNHVHGILIIKTDNSVETRHALSLQHALSLPESTIGQNRFQNQGKNSISSIVGSYKSAATKHLRRMGYEFAWQARFWDCIIRDENEYLRTAQYIIDNPMNWGKDKFNKGLESF